MCHTQECPARRSRSAEPANREPSQTSVIDFGDLSEVRYSTAFGVGADISRTPHTRRS